MTQMTPDPPEPTADEERAPDLAPISEEAGLPDNVNSDVPDIDGPAEPPD